MSAGCSLQHARCLDSPHAAVRPTEWGLPAGANLTSSLSREVSGKLGVIRRANRSSVVDTWPEVIRRRLQDMLKTGNRRIVAEFQRIEVDKDDREYRDWIPSTIATITGIDALDGTTIQDVGSRLKAVLEAREEAQASREIPEQTLQRWADALSNLNRCSTDLHEFQVSLNAFWRPDNL